MIAKAVDTLVEVFSPARALKRRFDREKIAALAKRAKRTEQYASSKTDRMTGTWAPANTGVNDIIGLSSQNVRARVRQLVRDFPYFASAINRLVDYTVGPGIVFQSKIQTADGQLDRKRIRQVEDAVLFWMDDADFAKKLHFYEIMQLVKRQDVEAGEFIIIKRYPNDRRYLPFALQVYEADWLTTEFDTYTSAVARPPGPNEPKFEIRQGIKYDRFTGQIISYFFCDPAAWGQTIEIFAKDIVHGFETLRPGQLRGISSFAPGVLLAHDLQDYMDAEMDAAKMAAKYLAFVKTPDAKSRTMGLDTETNDTSTQYIDEMENAIIEYLNPGEEIEISSNPRPGTNFPPFVRLILTMLSVTTGVPYELLSGDYQGMNYTTSRVSRNDFAFYLRPISARHVRQFCTRTITPFFDTAVAAGRLDLPNYFANPYPWLRSEWQPPGMDSVDPLREAKAAIDMKAALLKSPQELIRARGKDPEEVLKECAQWRDWLDEYDLTEEEVSTALANNPAAVDDQDKDERQIISLMKRLKGRKNAS